MTLDVPRCEFCGSTFEAGDEAICLRQGEHSVSEKHGGLFFSPLPFNDQEDHKWSHLRCWLDIFDMSSAEVEDLFTCAFCPEDLEGELYFYEMELSLFDEDQIGMFSMPKKDLQTGVVPRSYACKECIFDGIAGESSSTACRILALEADEDDVANELEEMKKFDDELAAARRIRTKRQRVDIGPPPRRRAV